MDNQVRLSLHSIFMSTAKLFAERSTCTRKKVGAILVRDNRIISSGYVGSPPNQPHCIDVGCIMGNNGGCIRTIHAEANAIMFAAKNGISTNNTILYTTLSPCIDCAKMIVAAGIVEIVYDEQYRDASPLDFLISCGINIGRFD